MTDTDVLLMEIGQLGYEIEQDLCDGYRIAFLPTNAMLFDHDDIVSFLALDAAGRSAFLDGTDDPQAHSFWISISTARDMYERGDRL